MKGTSKVIMGATLVMVVSLAIVLGLVIVLLAELYCSLLLRRRRQLRHSTAATTAATASITSSSQPQQAQPQSALPPPLSSFYAHGVLNAPRNLLYPTLPTKKEETQFVDSEKKQHQFLESQTQKSPTSPHQIGLLISTTPPPPPSSSPLPPNQKLHQVQTDKKTEHFVYISNPIYDNDNALPNRLNHDDDDETPFETPDTSPSRLEEGEEDSGEEGEDMVVDQVVVVGSCSSSSSVIINISTPPLTPMKKLPEKACSVCLKDARSTLGTSGSDDSNSHHNGHSSSSSSGSPSTSPSW